MSEEKKKSYSGEKSNGFKGGKGQGGRKFGQGKGAGRAGGFKGGKPSWKKDGEGKGESKDGKRFGDKPAWKKSGKPGFDKRRDDRGDKPAWKRDGEGRKDGKPSWKKDGEKRFDRSGDKRRDGFRKSDKGDFRKDGERPFEKKRGYVKVDESGENKPSFKKPAANRDDARREKRGDRYLRDNARLKSKKERDAAELAREDDFVYAGDHQLSKKAMEGIFVEIGETVAHENYGIGTVRKVTNGKVAVVFDGKYRWFAFPASLENGVLRQVEAASVEAQQESPSEPEIQQEDGSEEE